MRFNFIAVTITRKGEELKNQGLWFQSPLTLTALPLPPPPHHGIVITPYCLHSHCLLLHVPPPTLKSTTHPCFNNPNQSSRITSSQSAHAHHLLPTMAPKRRGGPGATSSPKRKRRQCSACIKKWQVAFWSTSNMPGDGKM